MSRLVACLVPAALLLAACSGGQTASPSPEAAPIIPKCV
jgi:hypothetical protein